MNMINKFTGYIIEKEMLEAIGVKNTKYGILMNEKQFYALIKGRENQLDLRMLKERKLHVRDYAPSDKIVIDGHYALIGEFIMDVSPYSENELIKRALCVDLDEELIDDRWAKTYFAVWFEGDKFEEPSETWTADVTEITPMIFRRKEMLIIKEDAK